MTARYAVGQIDSDSFQDWFLQVSLGGFADDDAKHLANRIEGLLAEASHTSWSEADLREELANVIRPAAIATQMHNPDAEAVV